MFEIKNEMIKFTKGDSVAFKVDLENADGTPYTMQAGDKLVFAIRKSMLQPVALRVESDTNVIVLMPDDSVNLELGLCYYDLKLITAAGEEYTVAGINSNSENMIIFGSVGEA